MRKPLHYSRATGRLGEPSLPFRGCMIVLTAIEFGVLCATDTTLTALRAAIREQFVLIYNTRFSQGSQPLQTERQ